MKITGEHHIPADRETVWKALNDPEVLKECLPGCESIEKTSDTEMKAKITTRIGPVKASFTGAVTLSDIDPPNGYTITGEGQGGAAGFASGSAKVHLADDGPGATVLTYEADAKVGGKLAQIGSRLIDSTVKKLSNEFFTAFAEKVGGAAQAGAAEAAAPPPEQPTLAEAAHDAAIKATAEAGAGVSSTASMAASATARAAAGASSHPPSTAKRSKGLNTALWVGGLVVIAVILILVFAL
ncbi:MAG: carbon monoxide dehydrogenase subunit G [Alphaproteobacteria bacterium]